MAETTITEKVKQGFFISRFPSWAKLAFVERADQEFEGDYGMCLAQMVKECVEYNRLKELLFSGQIPIGVNSQSETVSNKKEIKLANGKKLNLSEENKDE